MNNKLQNIANSAFNFPQIDSDLEVWFIFDEKKYEVYQFKINFGQSVDYKGQPQDEVRGGRILISLTETVPENLYKWAMISCPRNGVVEFRSKTTNSPLKVEFIDGYCVNFERNVDVFIGLNTDLIISAREIIINGINLDNHWV